MRTSMACLAELLRILFVLALLPALAHAQTATTTTFTVTPAAATVGQSLTLVAQVAGASPTGTVTFTAGGSPIGAVALNAGIASFATSALPQGSHSLAASYAGDANNQASSSGSVAVTVSARPPHTWQYGYDAMGRPNTVVDPNGLASYTYYDSLGRPIQSQQPANTGSSSPTIIDYGWNAGDSLTSVTDPRQLTTTYTVDGLGQTKAEASPDRGASQSTYDPKGNILSRTDARGKTTSYSYDAVDRITSISYPTGTPTTFEYDGGPSGQPHQSGELTKMTDESGQTVYSHDSLGRVTQKSVTIGTRSFTVGYSWGDSGTALDKLTAITYPSGTRVNYSYDQYGSVSGVTVNPVNTNGSGTSTSSIPLLSSITYNVDHSATGWLWSDGKPRSIGHDANGFVSSYTLGDPTGTGAAAGVLRTVQRDAAARITGYTHTGSGATGLDQTFAYDNLNRLTAATQGTASTSYSYDATGNRTQKTVAGTGYTNTVSPTSNRLTQVSSPSGTASIGHDAAGNVTADGSATFSYSDRGRMASATTSAGTVNYLYDGRNQRVKKSGPSSLVNTGEAYYVYDEAGQLLGEYDASGNPVYETIYLGSIPVGAMKQTGAAANNDLTTSLYNIHADHIDTPRVITRQDHTIVWRWDTAEAFGSTAPNQNPNGLGTFVFNQRFPGQVFDQETGLNQNWNREYDPFIGRYRQSDPIGVAGGVNTYGYGEQSPLQNTDPSGLITTEQAYCLRNPLECAEIMGDIASNAARAMGAECAANSIESAVDVLHVVSTVIDLRNLRGLAMSMAGNVGKVGRKRAGGGADYDPGAGGAGRGFGGGEAGGAAKGSKPLALGISEHLDNFAKSRGASTWKDLPEPTKWKSGVLDALADPSRQVHFNLDGVDVWKGVQRAASGRGGATDWELLQIRNNPQFWDSLQFWKGGQQVPNPFK